MLNFIRFTISSVLVLVLGGLWGGPPVEARTTNIKVAVVTPEGSAWVKVLKEMVADVQTQTNGEVKFTIYAGGISGDEADVLRKMRVNRLHAAGFSGVGLGIILPQIRVLEAPLLFRDDQEIDLVRDRIFDQFAAEFEKKGFVLLGFAEGGWVYLFSRQDLGLDSGLKSTKMWVWKGDRVAETFLNTFGVRTVPLHIADVNTGLETGMIDSYYSPPLAAVAFQWYARIDYMLNYPLANSTAALLMNKRTFGTLSAEHQDIIKTLSRKYCRKLVELTRKENQEALGVLRTQGIRFAQPTAQQIDAFHRDAQKTYSKSVPDLYPQTLLDQIQSILKKSRSKTEIDQKP